MTTEARRIATALTAVLACWLALMAIVMRLSGAAPAALVLSPPDDFAGRLPPGMANLSAGPISLTVSGAGNLTPVLYRAGAPLVLPTGLSGCLGELPTT